MSKEMDKKINSIIGGLDNAEKDALYRALWFDYVKEDVYSHCEDIGVKCDDDLAEQVANLYVYDGEYDCNICYWDNIENLINRFIDDDDYIDDDEGDDDDDVDYTDDDDD